MGFPVSLGKTDHGELPCFKSPGDTGSLPTPTPGRHQSYFLLTAPHPSTKFSGDLADLCVLLQGDHGVLSADLSVSVK